MSLVYSKSKITGLDIPVHLVGTIYSVSSLLMLLLLCVFVCSSDRQEVLRCWCWVWMVRARRVFFNALWQAARSRKCHPRRGSMPSLSTERSCTLSSSRVCTQPTRTAWLNIPHLHFNVLVVWVKNLDGDISLISYVRSKTVGEVLLQENN